MKACRTCKVSLPESAFYRDGKSADGFRYACKDCGNRLAIDWAQKNPTAVAEADRRYRKRHRDKVSAAQKTYRATRSGHYKQLRRASYEKNRKQEIARAQERNSRFAESIRNQRRVRYSEDPRYRALCVVHANKRRTTLKGGSLTVDQWLTIVEKYAGLCAYCGTTATAMDHVTPLCRGGDHSASNVVPACKPCNSRKRHRTPQEWRQAAA